MFFVTIGIRRQYFIHSAYLKRFPISSTVLGHDVVVRRRNGCLRRVTVLVKSSRLFLDDLPAITGCPFCEADTQPQLSTYDEIYFIMAGSLRESKRQKPAGNSARTSGAIRAELVPLPPLRVPPSLILSLLMGDGGVCLEVWRAAGEEGGPIQRSSAENRLVFVVCGLCSLDVFCLKENK